MAATACPVQAAVGRGTGNTSGDDASSCGLTSCHCVRVKGRKKVVGENIQQDRLLRSSVVHNMFLYAQVMLS
jgi:hypothetical protein